MLICCKVMRRWASAAASWAHTELSASKFVFLLVLLKKFTVALLTCIFALGMSLSLPAEFRVQFRFAPSFCYRCTIMNTRFQIRWVNALPAYAHYLLDEIPHRRMITFTGEITPHFVQKNEKFRLYSLTRCFNSFQDSRFFSCQNLCA